ncbi:MAG TPA: hypothetical protein P5016_01630 [Verrucomicrobiales bacterium]|nr:hypothetical protein [Verrucomicrobiales bacterium]
MKTLALSLIGGGLLAAAFGFSGLRRSGEDHPHGNPFAIERSGYGMTLARLSQDTVNTVWHLGVEGVAPHGEGDHDHEGEGHDEHDHAEAGHDDHDEAAEGHANQEGKEPALAAAPGAEDPEAARLERLHDALHGHKKGAGHDCDDEDCPFHQHGEHCHHEEVTHDHLTEAKDFLWDLSKTVRYGRTNRRPISEAHRLSVAGDIEEMLLRAYRMDPSDYGVYNSYFLFLTINDLRATPVAREQARKISNNTIGEAFAQKEDPAAWLTASGAVLNLFFLDLEDGKQAGKPMAREAVSSYKQKMGYCLQQYAVLKREADRDGRWELLSSDLQKQILERELFNRRTFAQFDAMLERSSLPGGGPGQISKQPSSPGSAVTSKSDVEDN